MMNKYEIGFKVLERCIKVVHN